MRSRDDDGPVAMDVDRPPVHVELGTLQNQVDRLNSLTIELDERLASVRNSTPTENAVPNVGAASPAYSGSPVRQTVNLISDTVIGIQRRIERILGELEI